MIASFEKNPDMNGIPIKAREVILKAEKGIGDEELNGLIWRISW